MQRDAHGRCSIGALTGAYLCVQHAQKTVRVAVIGAPNAGKSTLTNALVGRLVTAVSRKTNTTRAEALGALTRGDTQLLLYDTPGTQSCKPSWDWAAKRCSTRN